MAENQKVDLSTLPKGLTKEEFTALPNFKKIRSFFTWAGVVSIVSGIFVLSSIGHISQSILQNGGSSNIDNVLDDRQIDAVKRSAEAGKPVLGICKGIQLVNVAFGGTLNQNIGGHMGVWHSAHVVAGGWLSGVYSGSVSVLSYHHQSIRDLAPGFQVDMRAGDGTVEAISNSAKRVYGVQFHPEQMNNDAGNRCMKQFVAICTN